MKLFSVMFLLGVLVQSQNALASGCGWERVFEKRDLLSSALVKGEFQCRQAYGDSQYCRFVAKEIGDIDDVPWAIIRPPAAKPPEGQKFALLLKAYDAMEWWSCDGTDLPPEFNSTGKIWEVSYDQINFSAYVAKRK